MIFCDWFLSLGLMFPWIIHVILCVSIPFLFTVKWYSIVGGHHILFTYSLFNEHFGCSHFLIIKNNVAMSICAQVLLGHLFSFLWGIYLGVQFLGCMVILCLIFWGDTILFSKVAEPFCIPISKCIRVLISPCVVISLFYYSHTNRYMASHCGLDLQFPDG